MVAKATAATTAMAAGKAAAMKMPAAAKAAMAWALQRAPKHVIALPDETQTTPPAGKAVAAAQSTAGKATAAAVPPTLTARKAIAAAPPTVAATKAAPQATAGRVTYTNHTSHLFRSTGPAPKTWQGLPYVRFLWLSVMLNECFCLGLHYSECPFALPYATSLVLGPACLRCGPCI